MTSLEKTILIITLIILIYCFTRSKGKHHLKIKKSKVILQKIKELDPQFRISYLRKIDAYVFEELILTTLQLKGFVIKRNARYSGDGGIDGFFQYNGKTWLIQAKRYQNSIKPEHVRDFVKVANDLGCGGIFVHTGRTPESVKRFISQNGNSDIQIISGKRLAYFFDTEKKHEF